MPVARNTISLEHLDAQASRNGVPASARAIMLGYFQAAEAGEFARVDPTLAMILGRRPVAMRAFLQQHLTR
jgi:NAD(P)H dehydrogenase (quinone)